jgi:signal transduction histidine kinase/ActR/RegA family two-component response regulator
MQKKRKQAVSHILLTILNMGLVALLISLFVNYNQGKQAKMKESNVTNIGNINHLAARTASTVFMDQEEKLMDKKKWIQKSAYTMSQAENYLANSNSDPTGFFELVNCKDYSGYSIDNDSTVTEISYQNTDYASLQSIFKAVSENPDTVSYTPEFTDAYKAVQSLAFYSYLTFSDKSDSYTLLYVSKSKVYSSLFQDTSEYETLATVLMNPSGNYLFSHASFPSVNLFTYLRAFNGLSLDEENALVAEVQSSTSGTLWYKDSKGEDCVFLYYRPDDVSWYAVTSVPLSSFKGIDNGNRFTLMITLILSLMLVMDLTVLGLLNSRLNVSIRREEEANASKTEFFARMSHDMRTPLNAIIGFTAITEQRNDLSEPVRDNLMKIDTSGRYLLGLINDVLDMSKIESGKIELHEENVDVRSFFSEIIDVFTDEAKRKGITLVTDFDYDGITYLIFDPLRTRQIYSNLLSNAIKFSESGTAITWTFRLTEAKDGLVHVVSTVKDQGCGMSPEYMKHLFTPFYQEQNVHSKESSGTGLGLAIVHNLVELQHGTVTAESKLGEGTMFTVTLTRKIGTAPVLTNPKTPAPADDSILKGKRVLLVEDNALNREIAETLLASKGMLIESAEDGKKGLDRFLASAPGYYDLILMDIRMPVMNGLEATKAIRSSSHPDAKKIPIVAMTANAYDEDVEESLAAGMNAHLPKPFEPKKLYQTIRVLLLKS